MGVEDLFDLIEEAGGKVESVSGTLPDGSGFATASFPLPSDHWLTEPGLDEPPMPFRIGNGERRSALAKSVGAAARYAIRASTMNGKHEDFDPDAMVQNMVVGMLGYWTRDGLSHLDDIKPRE